jgi:hypothetical protein
MKRVNELREGLENYELDDAHLGLANDPNVALTCSARGLMKEMQNKGASFEPY